MNYLQLCQRLCDKVEIGRTGFTDVTGQTGELLDVVNWINSAWMDIQMMRQDWEWLRASASCTTVNAQATYSASTDFSLTDFGTWARDTFRIYTTATGTSSEIFLPYVPYDDWRDTYQFGSMRTAYSQPIVFSISPANLICLGPVPTGGYTVTGDYYKIPTEMSASADIPALPTQFHMAIVYRAMMFYGVQYAAAEIYQHGEREFDRMKKLMGIEGLSEITFGGPLV